LSGTPGHSLTNVAFGGADRRSLFATDSTQGVILKAQMDVAGVALHSGVRK
jgi:gluconolactonase